MLVTIGCHILALTVLSRLKRLEESRRKLQSMFFHRDWQSRWNETLFILLRPAFSGDWMEATLFKDILKCKYRTLICSFCGQLNWDVCGNLRHNSKLQSKAKLSKGLLLVSWVCSGFCKKIEYICMCSGNINKCYVKSCSRCWLVSWAAVNIFWNVDDCVSF